jgi:hypothetical protein
MTIRLEPKDYVTGAEAARILGVSRGAITYFVRHRELFPVKVRFALLLKRSAVEALKQRRAGR